jgi:hypothetical protein
MAWPNTKAGTTNVDAGSDSPSSARADIKQNIDNVNAIIDEFDIASPSNGDILTYNSTSGAWEPTAQATGSSVSYVRIASGEELVSGVTYRRTVEERFDNAGIISLNGSYQFTLSAGTYHIAVEPITVDDNEAGIFLFNETDSVTVQSFNNNEIGTVGESIITGDGSFTINATKNFSFRQSDADAADRNATATFRITK